MAKFLCAPFSCLCYCCALSQRFVITFLCINGIIIAISQRSVLSIAIVKMVSQKVRNLSRECLKDNKTVAAPMGEAKDWNEMQQQIILLSFYVGYFLTHVPCTLLTHHLGPRRMFFGSMFISTLMTLATPFSAMYLNWLVLVGIRFVLGIAQAAVYPCVSVIVSNWIPSQERGMWGGLTLATANLGLALGILISGQVIKYTQFWPSAFFLWSSLGCTWCLLCLIYVYDDVSHHPRVRQSEFVFLEEHIHQMSMPRIPWKDILTDKDIIVIIIGNFGPNLLHFLNLTNMPKYLDNILHMEMDELSLSVSLPSLFVWISTVLSGCLVNYIITLRSYNVKWVRRYVSLFGTILPVSCMVGISYMGCQHTLVIVLYCTCIFFRGPLYCSLKINHMDITHNFCGVVASVINCVGCLAGIAGPLIVAFLAPNYDFYGLRNVFWTVFGVSLVCEVIYFRFANAQRATWDIDVLDDNSFFDEDQVQEKPRRKKQSYWKL